MSSNPGSGDVGDVGHGVRYLSDEWLDEADRQLGDLEPISGRVTVDVVVRSGPEGDRAYRLILGPDRVGIDRGSAPDPGNGARSSGGTTVASGVRMTLPWTVAVAIARGRASAQRAFLDGHIQFGGDASLLIGHQRELADIDDRLAELRSVTRYH